jgi:hypothetical protein
MKTHIAPIYLILGLMAVSALTIGASEPLASSTAPVAEAMTSPAVAPAHTVEFKRTNASAFQATSPGMAMPGRLVVIVTDKLEGQVEKRVTAALAGARARRKAG